MVFLIAAIIIFAVIQRHKYRRIDKRGKRDKWSRRWERMQSRGQAESDSGHTGNEKWDKWSRQWQDWERWARDTRNQAADVGHKVASTLEMAEAKLRREADRLRPGAAGAGEAAASQSRGNSAGTSAASGADQRAAQLDKDAERKAYERARRRASREAGFYVHLMWYGIVIGFLFMIVNLIVSPSFEWWVFRPRSDGALGWPATSAAVYGWRWIHERVFEPAVQREVQREVTQRERSHCAPRSRPRSTS